ncbi:MAG: hypothetical protein CSA35_06750 [Dethiosulfovibrio peptidovorans]|nr:MAG: hypothetical protein CSA35_06750 [Dethiosulfovibrio peptidovorans]
MTFMPMARTIADLHGLSSEKMFNLAPIWFLFFLCIWGSCSQESHRDLSFEGESQNLPEEKSGSGLTLLLFSEKWGG